MNYEIKYKDKTLAKSARLADNMFDRIVGLMFKKEMYDYDALIIKPCNSIHTFFMRYPIDVLFLNKENKIVKIKKNIKPWRMTGIYFKSNQVLEFYAGTIDDSVQEGEELEVKCIN